MSNPKRICLTPKVSGVGGMVSFQHKLAAGLQARGWEVCYDPDDWPYRAVLVIGGTRRLGALWRARRRGARIVQRLDGMNWLHRRLKTGPRHFVRAEYGNRLLALLRRRLAQAIVYQSEFSRRWWEAEQGPTLVENQVIYNGVDLARYTPAGPHDRPTDRFRLLMVEGSLMGGYEMGLEVGVDLARRLAGLCERPVELMVVGKVAPELRQRYEALLADADPAPTLTWVGQVPQADIPAIDRSAHLLYSADINAACPNSVIEALACGLPVVSFDTGALPELVPAQAGRIALYGGDPWRLEPPDVEGLASAAGEVLARLDDFRSGARAQAEAAFSLDAMVGEYLQILDVK